jgi:hypothetical protein
VVIASNGLSVHAGGDAGSQHHDHGLTDSTRGRQKQSADDAGQRCGQDDALDGFGAGRAETERAVTQRTRHLRDDIVGQRGDERDQHDAHDETGRENALRLDEEV